MSQTIDLKEIERKAFTSYFQDGFWELMLGLVLLQIAGGRILEYFGLSDYWGAAIAFFGVLLMVVGKKTITVPRMGHVNFGPARKRSLMKVTLILSISVAFSLIGYLIAASSPNIEMDRLTFPILFAVKAIVVFAIMAYLMDFDRLYFYGVLIGISMLVGEIWYISTGFYYAISIVFGFSSLSLIVIGSVLLYRFLNAYPLPTAQSEEMAR